MRTAADRIRHAISFELIGLALIIPLGSWAFSVPVTDIGIVGVVLVIVIILVLMRVI